MGVAGAGSLKPTPGWLPLTTVIVALAEAEAEARSAVRRARPMPRTVGATLLLLSALLRRRVGSPARHARELRRAVGLALGHNREEERVSEVDDLRAVRPYERRADARGPCLV